MFNVDLFFKFKVSYDFGIITPIGHRVYGTWSYGIHLCLLRNESLMKERNKRFEYWLGYFMYEEGKIMHISFQYTNVNMEML